MQEQEHNTDKGKQQSYDDDDGITWFFSIPSRKMETWNCRLRLVLAVIAIIWRSWHWLCDDSRANEGLSKNLAWRHYSVGMAHFPFRTWLHTETLVAKQHQLIMCRGKTGLIAVNETCGSFAPHGQHEEYCRTSHWHEDETFFHYGTGAEDGQA